MGECYKTTRGNTKAEASGTCRTPPRRNAILVEIDPIYVQTARLRIDRKLIFETADRGGLLDLMEGAA
jgi:hypothetical protein